MAKDPGAIPSEVLDKMREICLALPDTKETITWGEPHFRVGEKIFAGCGDEKGRLAIGFKLEMDHAARMVKIPGFWKAPYVGHKGWVSMDASVIADWDMVRELIHESYRLIAPKKSLAKLLSDSAPRKPATRKTPNKKTLRKSSLKKTNVQRKASMKKPLKKSAPRKKSQTRSR